MRIELAKGKKWYWRAVSISNGQTILTSETYYSKWNAQRAAKKIAAANNLSYVETA